MLLLVLPQHTPQHHATEFAQLFETTPPALIANGLYSAIAIALYAPPHRAVSLVDEYQGLLLVEGAA